MLLQNDTQGIEPRLHGRKTIMFEGQSSCKVFDETGQPARKQIDRALKSLDTRMRPLQPRKNVEDQPWRDDFAVVVSKLV